MQTVLVTIEEGKVAGETIPVQSQDGRNFEVIIPMGLTTRYFYVDLPDQLPGGLIDAAGNASASTAANDAALQNASRGSASSKIMGGAAAAAGIFGMMVAGPLVGIGLAGGAAYAATRQGSIGDAARATGSAAVVVGSNTYKASKDLNQKYDLSGKAAIAATSAAKGLESVAKSVERRFSGSNNNNSGSNGDSAVGYTTVPSAPSAPSASF
jgi:hypothetical protein